MPYLIIDTSKSNDLILLYYRLKIRVFFISCILYQYNPPHDDQTLFREKRRIMPFTLFTDTLVFLVCLVTISIYYK